ncbi:Probable cobalt transporter subunit (CbtA) [Halopenitus malekzadehii]|uniref:Probable cobalt transporter subunit (CbtA) n=1 Tax=Halopenitus malekzadehii TaxID=1267564 RepID=A0A1H6HW09_9EURY|nr:CbtA family protein [Halopenitus malekzadehii]SEH40335.1 Probable cobalt transporter subunit (CbtA) [Halopenitus malekzadehii]
MLAEYLTRGVKAGAVAGLVFGLFVALVAAPTVAFADELGHDDAAIEAGGTDATTADHTHEEGGHAHGDDGGHDHAEEGGHAHDAAVSGPVTTVVSIASSALWGVLLGAVVFGAGFYLLEPLLPGAPGSGVKQAVLAGIGFITVSGAPWLVLPPRSPGVEASLTISTRLWLYGGMMVLGAISGLLALWTFDRLRPAERADVAARADVDGRVDADGRDGHGRSPALAAAGALAPFGLLVIAAFLAPTTTVESTLPASLSAGLVGMTVFGQLLLWATLAGAHAWLVRRRRGTGRPIDAVNSESDAGRTPDDDPGTGSSRPRSAD